MYQIQREKSILKLLNERKTLSTHEIIAELNTSRETVRRDIIKLVDSGLVVRAHGCIMLPQEEVPVLNYQQRMSQLSTQKQHIAQEVTKLIQKNSIIFLDVSTTLNKVCQTLDIPCIVYTHSLDNALALANNPQIELHLLGGTFDHQSRFVSPDNLSSLNDVKFDNIFLGACSLEEDGAYVEESDNAKLKRILIQRSRTTTLISETQKFFKHGNYRFSTYPQVDIFATDQKPTDQQINLLDPATKIIY